MDQNAKKAYNKLKKKRAIQGRKPGFSLEQLAEDIKARHKTPVYVDKNLAEVAQKKTLASKIVSVQPMSNKRGFVFWLDYKYSKPAVVDAPIQKGGRLTIDMPSSIPEIDIKIESETCEAKPHPGSTTTSGVIEAIDKTVLRDLFRVAEEKQVTKSALDMELVDAANTIHRNTLRGMANFVVCHPEMKKNIPTYSRFKVYTSKFCPRNSLLVGYKGGSYLESGYIYAPYKREDEKIYAVRHTVNPKFYMVLKVI